MKTCWKLVVSFKCSVWLDHSQRYAVKRMVLLGLKTPYSWSSHLSFLMRIVMHQKCSLICVHSHQDVRKVFSPLSPTSVHFTNCEKKKAAIPLHSEAVARPVLSPGTLPALLHLLHFLPGWPQDHEQCLCPDEAWADRSSPSGLWGWLKREQATISDPSVILSLCLPCLVLGITQQSAPWGLGADAWGCLQSITITLKADLALNGTRKKPRIPSNTMILP